MFKQILLPTDGSELSERAVLAGISFAKEIGAQVVGVTVLPEFHTFSLIPDQVEDTRERYDAEIAQLGERYLSFIGDAARSANVPCATVKLTSDDPYEAILATAKERKCDLIIMASHGRKGIKGVLLGSETQKVLVHSDMPVLVYR